MLKNFFDNERTERLNLFLTDLWERRSHPKNPIVIDTFIGTPKEKRILFKNALDIAKASPYKLNDLYLEYSEIRDLALDVDLSVILGQLLDGSPMICNTLNFEFGSQQDDHIDTFYMPPRVPNRMVASWIALEDATATSGPLRYYPGSHKIPPFLFSHGKTNAIPKEMPDFRRFIKHEIEKRNLVPVELLAQKGDVFIWHAQLLHGGSAIRNLSETRRSLVSHYFRAKDYRHHFWRVKKNHQHGFHYHRKHQPTDDDI